MWIDRLVLNAIRRHKTDISNMVSVSKEYLKDMMAVEFH